MTPRAPQWLEVCVIEGLQMLLTLRLRNAPPVDTVEAVVEIWLAVCMARPVQWEPERDAPRIRHAFLALAGMQDAWPAPARLFELLPAPPDPPRLSGPPPVPTPPHIRAKFQALVQQMRSTPRPTPRKKGIQP